MYYSADEYVTIIAAIITFSLLLDFCCNSDYSEGNKKIHKIMNTSKDSFNQLRSWDLATKEVNATQVRVTLPVLDVKNTSMNELEGMLDEHPHAPEVCTDQGLVWYSGDKHGLVVNSLEFAKLLVQRGAEVIDKEICYLKL